MLVNKGIVDNRTRSPIDSLLHRVPFGDTYTVVNGVPFPSATNPDGYKTALRAPKFTVRPRPGGNGVELVVHEEPINEYHMLVEALGIGPWTRTTEKARIQGMIESDRDYARNPRFPHADEDFADASSDMRLTVRGTPDDHAFAAKVYRHEEAHVRANWSRIAQILKPWDAAIAHAVTSGTRIVADDEGQAKQEFYRLAGGDPEAIMCRLTDAIRDDGIAFHRTRIGGMPWIMNYAVRGNTVDVYYDTYDVVNDG